MQINGKEMDIQFKTISEIIEHLEVDPQTVAVTIDLEIIDPSKYHDQLNGSEIIDIISFVSGG